jgi:hypothetical protein
MGRGAGAGSPWGAGGRAARAGRRIWGRARGGGGRGTSRRAAAAGAVVDAWRTTWGSHSRCRRDCGCWGVSKRAAGVNKTDPKLWAAQLGAGQLQTSQTAIDDEMADSHPVPQPEARPGIRRVRRERVAVHSGRHSEHLRSSGRGGRGKGRRGPGWRVASLYAPWVRAAHVTRRLARGRGRPPAGPAPSPARPMPPPATTQLSLSSPSLRASRLDVMPDCSLVPRSQIQIHLPAFRLPLWAAQSIHFITLSPQIKPYSSQ